MMSATTNRTKKRKNKTLAIPAAVPAIPPNPKTAAITETTKNTKAQYNMAVVPFLKSGCRSVETDGLAGSNQLTFIIKQTKCQIADKISNDVLTSRICA